MREDEKFCACDVAGILPPEISAKSHVLVLLLPNIGDNGAHAFACILDDHFSLEDGLPRKNTVALNARAAKNESCVLVLQAMTRQSVRNSTTLAQGGARGDEHSRGERDEHSRGE